MSEQRSGKQVITDVGDFYVTPTGGSRGRLKDHVSGFVNVRSYGAACDGVTDDYADLAAMVTALDATSATLIVPGPCLVGSDLAIPSTIRVRFEGAGKFTGAGRVTFTPFDTATPTWDTLSYPVIIGHRGAASYLPESTTPSWDEVAAMGLPIETDVHASSDGWLVCIHDTTTDRTTGTAGTVASLSLSALRALNASALVPGYPATQIPTFAEYLTRYAGRHLLMPEVKVSAIAKQVAREVASRGLQRGTVIQSFNHPDATAIHEVDPTIKVLITATSATAVSTLQFYGAWAVGPVSTAVTAQYVADCHAAGIKVIPYIVDEVSKAEDMVISKGADGVFSNDPGYIRKFLGAVSRSGEAVPVPSRLPASGWAGSLSGGTLGVSGGFATFPGATYSGSNGYVHAPLRSPEGTYQIDTSIKLTSKNTGDLTRYIGVRFGWSIDHDNVMFGSAGSTGYHFAYRSSGAVEIVRDTGGVAATIGSATWAALAEGNVIPLRVSVTPTTITVTRTDTSATVTATDATHPRRGWFGAFGASNVVGLGDSVITY
jgi:glycerophosphoryl diester phosphodiesterase